MSGERIWRVECEAINGEEFELGHRVTFSVGGQKFTIDATFDTLEEAEWMQMRLQHALLRIERGNDGNDHEIAERAREWAKLLDALGREEDDYARGSIWNGAEEAKRALLAAVRKHQEKKE